MTSQDPSLREPQYDELNAWEADQETKRLEVIDSMRRAAWKDIMQTAYGRQIMYEFMASCEIYGEPHRPNPYDTSYNCGRASAGRQVLAQVMAADEQMYLVMMREAHERHDYEQQLSRQRLARRERYDEGWRPGDDE